MPRKVYSCSINSANDDTVWHRQTLLRLSKAIDFSDPLMDAFSLDFLSEAVMESHSQKRLDTFYMVQTMASTSSRIGSFAAAASKNYDIHLLPWASVAACVSDDSSNVIFVTLLLMRHCSFSFSTTTCPHMMSE